MKPAAIAYLRVSTVEQKSGYGLDVQEKSVRGYARGRGLSLVDVVRDEALSGTTGPEVRPGLASALLRLQNGEATVLLVPRLDRLARDVILQETIIRQLEATGRRVESVAEPDIEAENGQRTLIRTILGAIAEYEATLIRARMRAGRELKATRGGYAHGRPPYGYRANKGTLLKDPQEQAVIRKARLLRRRGLSFREIADALAAEGHAPRSGRRWHPPMVARLVDRPADARSAA